MTKDAIIQVLKKRFNKRSKKEKIKLYIRVVVGLYIISIRLTDHLKRLQKRRKRKNKQTHTLLFCTI